MGWYTRGPGNLEYKFGNVLSLAAESGVGRVGLVAALTIQGEKIDTTEFLDVLQPRIEARDLPWSHLTLIGDSSAISFDRDGDLEGWMEETAAEMRDHLDSIRAVTQPNLHRVALEISPRLIIDKDEYPALEAWLNANLDAPLLTADNLRRGALDAHGWYGPPPELAAILEEFESDDEEDRLFAVHAWAHALLSDETLELYEPSDDHILDVWTSDMDENPAAALLFCPDEVPFLALLAEAFELPASVRRCCFFLYSTDHEASLPPEPDVPPDDVRRGMAFCRYLNGRIFAVLPPVRALILHLDETRGFEIGWHPSADATELTKAFEASGLSVSDLAATLRNAHTHGEAVSTFARLEVWHEVSRERGDTKAASTLDYVVDGTGEPPRPDPSSIHGEIATLAWVCTDLALPAIVRDRLAEIVKADAAAWIAEQPA